MSFPQIRLLPLHCVLILVLLTTPSLFGQTPTPTPPLDTDGDGVPDHQDGWPQHKQITTPHVPESGYAVIHLGHGIGLAVNNLGDVVGQSFNDNGEPEAILWRLGQSPKFLGFFTQDQTLVRWSIARGINDARQITGSSTFSWDLNVSGEYPEPPSNPVWDYTSSLHAFLWQTGTMTELSDLSFGQPFDPNYPAPTGKGYSEGRAINRYGVIVGQSDTGLATQNTGWAWHLVDNTLLAVKFNGIAPFDLGIISLDGTSEAAAINDRGAIAGSRRGAQEAFFQFSGQTQFVAAAPGTTYANGLNNLDHVVGVAGDSPSAFIWVPTSSLPENERVIDLGPMSLQANLQYTSAGAFTFGENGSQRLRKWDRRSTAKLSSRLRRTNTDALMPSINSVG